MNGTRASGSAEGIIGKRAFGRLLWGLFCILLAAGCSGGDRRDKPAASAPSGTEAPRASALADFLKAEKLEGKVVLIEFGLYNCALSDQGLGEMTALARGNAIPGLAFARVEAGQDRSAADEYYRGKAPPFPVYRDAAAALGKALEATAYPTFLLVDKFGHVRYRGRYPGQQLASWAKALLEEQKDPGPGVAMLGAVELDVPRLLAETKLPDLKDTVKPLGDYLGPGGLLVLFVDARCPFSAAGIKDMPTVSEELLRHKINSVVINSDDARQAVQEYYAKHQTGTPVLYDVAAATRDRWNVQAVPTAVLLSADRKLLYHGRAVWGDLGAAAEKALGFAPGTVKFAAQGTGFG